MSSLVNSNHVCSNTGDRHRVAYGIRASHYNIHGAIEPNARLWWVVELRPLVEYPHLARAKQAAEKLLAEMIKECGCVEPDEWQDGARIE